MIDPSLEGDSADYPEDRANPLIPNAAGVSNETNRHNEEAEKLQNNLKSHA
jgi:hypothetical protein